LRVAKKVREFTLWKGLGDIQESMGREKKKREKKRSKPGIEVYLNQKNGGGQYNIGPSLCPGSEGERSLSREKELRKRFDRVHNESKGKGASKTRSKIRNVGRGLGGGGVSQRKLRLVQGEKDGRNLNKEKKNEGGGRDSHQARILNVKLHD